MKLFRRNDDTQMLEEQEELKRHSQTLKELSEELKKTTQIMQQQIIQLRDDKGR